MSKKDNYYYDDDYDGDYFDLMATAKRKLEQENRKIQKMRIMKIAECMEKNKYKDSKRPKPHRKKINRAAND